MALIHSDLISNTENGIEVHSTQFGYSYDLCPNEPFYTQPIAPFCSGFLVTPNTIITAGHCVASQDACESIYFAFGYGLHSPEQSLDIISENNIYTCKELIHRQSTDADFAIIQLDRDVAGRNPLPIRKSGSISEDSPLLVIGHPSGLPTKVAAGARVQSISNDFFTANLDTYGGNSGSAVINKDSLVVEGILIRGESDYVWDTERQCNQSHHCTAEDDCMGEDVTKITEVLDYIPSLPEEI